LEYNSTDDFVAQIAADLAHNSSPVSQASKEDHIQAGLERRRKER
jgi:hypothetical protein